MPSFNLNGSKRNVHLSLPHDFTEESTLAYEKAAIKQGLLPVAGVDEAGRGPLAGPVVAACVLLPTSCPEGVFRDSKKLSARQREKLFQLLQQRGACLGLGAASPEEIAALNIHHATLLAMQRAVDACALANNDVVPACLLVDGLFTLPLDIPQQALVRGESRSASIAAASIAAKVSRDAYMMDLHNRFPQYNFAKHKGYPTKEHLQAIRTHGPCPHHRSSFRGVREYVQQQQAA